MPLTDDTGSAPRPAPDRRRPAFSRRRLALAAAVALALLVLSGATIGRSWSRKVAHLVSNGGSSSGTPHIIDDVTVKGDLAGALPAAPKVIILGGSRGLRFEPSYIEKKTGLRAFNAGVPNERPEEAWAMVHFIHDLYPHVRPRYLWFIHVKFLRNWQYVSPGLVDDERFSRYFSEEFLNEQRALMPRKYVVGDRTLRLTDPARYAPDGRVIKVHDWTQEHVDSLIEEYTRRWIKKFGPGSPTIDERARTYFEKTLGYMNKLGATPVLVLTPMHPRMLAAIADQGWLEARSDLMRYLRTLSPRYHLTVVDLSRVSSFGGDPDNFYDGYHPKIENTRLIIDEILRRLPHAFD